MTANDPVVVTSSHRVAAEKKETFTISANSLLSMAARSRGYLGGELRTSGQDDSVWQIVYRFDSAEAAAAWRTESSRSLWATVLEECAQSLAQRSSGPDRRAGRRPDRRPDRRADARTVPRLAPKAAPGPGPAKPAMPPRWKMAVVTLIAVFPAVLGTNVIVVSQLAGLSLIPRTFVLCVIVTILMTWVLMPRLMKLLGPWLRGNAPVPAEAARAEPEPEREQPARTATSDDDKPREALSDDTIPIPIQLPSPTPPPPAMPPPMPPTVPSVPVPPPGRSRHRAPAHRVRNQPAPSRPGRQVPSGRR